MTPPGERDRRLENYDRALAESRARVRAAVERRRAWELKQLDRERLSPAARERRERELRLKWWHEDFNEDLDSRIRREALVRRLDEIDERAARFRRAEEARTVKHTEWMMGFHRGSGRTPVHVARMFHRIRTECPAIRRFQTYARKSISGRANLTSKSVDCKAGQRVCLAAHQGIEIAPIRSEAAFATAAHEIGHVACPCEPDHVRVPRKTWLGTVCVACELAAWRWAITHSPRWSQAMHADMADALPSYRDYGSAEQQAAIDRLTSRLGFHEIRLQRVTQKG